MENLIHCVHPIIILENQPAGVEGDWKGNRMAESSTYTELKLAFGQDAKNLFRVIRSDYECSL
jgi:hypothetical protein